MTTSLKVAEVFGLLHKNVMQAIQNLDCSRAFFGLNFQLEGYDVKTGFGTRKAPMYLMTRDGFTFLAMSDAGATGFNGARAAEFKERYITEFNRMEAELRGKIKADPVVNSVVVAMTTTTRGGISEQRCRRNFYGPRP